MPEYVVQARLRVVVDREVAGPVPIGEVLAAWRRFCGDEILTGKELAENGLGASVSIQIEDLRVQAPPRAQAALPKSVPWDFDPVKPVEKTTWRTRWGTLMLQTEHPIGEPRWHYAQWHSDANRPPRHGIEGSTDKRVARRRIQRWVDANGGEVP